ncbi:hypothetical protein OXX59_005150 [Metschnikowia pulcherrima]
MSQESASTYSQLNPLVLSTELETSTPINPQRHRENTGIDPLQLPNHESASIRQRGPSHSILKHTNKTPFDESSLTYKGNEIPRANGELNSSYYSVANEASRNPLLQQSRAQKVYFSPTKEVVSYDEEQDRDFRVDLMQLERSAKDQHQQSDMKGIKSEISPKSPFWRNLAVDPRVPYVLSLYLQLFFNCVIIFVVLYLLYVFISTVRQDVKHKIEMYTADALREISLCSRQYYRNKCANEGTNTRAPALEETCTNLEKCMNRDPQQIGKSQITAETFADIVNGFLHPISWKSSILFSGLIVGGVFVVNVAFGTYRSRAGMETFEQVNLRNSQKQKQIISHEQVVVATPPNPPPNVRDDSMLPYSSPLSSRGKTGQ